MEFRDFLKNLRFVTKEYKFRTLEPNADQQMVLPFLERKQHLLVLQERQVGFSTLTHAWVLWNAMFNENVRCGVLSHSEEGRSANFRSVYQMFNANLFKGNTPDGIDTIGVKRHTISFNNGSEVQCMTTAALGGTYDILQLSEFDFYRGGFDRINRMLPELMRDGGQVIANTFPREDGSAYRLFSGEQQLNVEGPVQKLSFGIDVSPSQQ